MVLFIFVMAGIYGGFMTPTELRATKDTLETWSKLCLENLDELTTGVESATC